MSPYLAHRLDGCNPLSKLIRCRPVDVNHGAGTST